MSLTERTATELLALLARGETTAEHLTAPEPTCPGDEPFHNEYRPHEVRQMLMATGFKIERIWFSALHFNVLFAGRRAS